ncbi:MAG: PAS domain-containing protein [Lentisphaeria bacterium]|nr:PAS domain-containing protein [Lentisphaeria bacterium]
MTKERTKNGTIRLAAEAFDAVYRHLSDGVVACGKDGMILYTNPVAEKVFGRSLDELAGHDLDEIVPASSAAFHDGVCRVGVPGFELVFHVCAESAGPWYESVMQPAVLSDGTEAGILFFSVRASENAAAAENSYQKTILLTLANNMPLGIYVLEVDCGFRLLRANRHFAQTFHVEHAAVRGKTPADFLPAPVAAKWRSFSEATVQKGGETQTFRLQMLDEKGFPQFVHFTESLYVDPATGRRLILGMVEDITAEAFFHKYESANAEILRRTQQETDLKSVLSIITEIIFREFDSCRMVWMDREMNAQMDFVRADMKEKLPKLTPELREKLVGYMRPILKEKHACAIPEIAHVPELAAISEQCPGYPRCQLAFEIFNQKRYIGTMLIQFTDRMPFPTYNLEPRLMLVDTFSAILYRIREQQSLADSNRLLEQIIDTLPMSFFVKNVDNGFRYSMCNRKFCRMIGRTRDEVIGRMDCDFMPKIVADKLTADQISAMNSKELIHADVEEIVPGVGWHVFEKWLLPFRSDTGGRMLVGIMHDVTEERKLHAVEKFKMNILSYFNDNPDIRDFCDYLAGQMLDILHCDRVLMLPQKSSDRFRLTNEWTRSGIERIGKHDTNCPILKLCRDKKSEPVLAFEDAEALYADLPNVVCHAKSAIIARVTFNGRFWGGLAVHYVNFRTILTPADLQMVQVAASLLSMAVERGIAMREIQQRERENQLLIDNTIIPVAMFDGSGRLLRCNKPYQESIALLEREVKPQLLQSIMNGLRTSSIQRKVNGKIWQIDAHGVTDDSNNLSYIFMFAVDITESDRRIRRQEATSACMEAILSEADEDSRAFQEVVRVVAGYFSADGGNFIHFRPEGVELLATWGFEDGDQPFSPFIMKIREYTEFDEEWMARLERCDITVDNDLPNIPIEDPSLSKLVRSTGMGTRCSFKLSHGDRVWGAVSLYFKDPWRSFSQTDYEMLGNFQHTSNMMLLKYELTQNLKQERDKAISAEKAKSFFFSCVSHDIRTPLNSIIGFSELLQQGDVPKEKAVEYLGNIIFSGNTLMQLINDVLDFASLDAGKLKLFPAMCDFRRLAESVLTIVGDAARNKSLYLKLDADGEIPWVKVDSQRISQILFNLIGNAVKFTEKGGVTLHIRFVPDARTADGKKTGTLVFTVQDTGIGIDKSHFSELMQPFVRIHTRNQVGGTGLGLSICNLMVAKMGGRIRIDSEVGVGSSFAVELPRIEYQTEAPAELEQQAETHALPEDIDLVLLLVDDSELNLKVLEALCRKLGVRNIHTATSGRDAMVKMNDTMFDAVLTDVWMPNMSGPELAAEIRRNPMWRDLPVYALTADVEMVKREDPAPFTGILLKPLRTENIAELLLKITAAKK